MTSSGTITQKRFGLRILDRYFGAEFLKTFLFALSAFTMIFVVLTVLELLRLDLKGDRSGLLIYILYRLPRITAEVIPASLLFGVCFTTAQFSVAREIVAMQSAGISFYRAVLAVFITGAAMTVFLFFFQNLVVSPANAAAEEQLASIRKDVRPIRDLVWQKNLRGREGYYFIYFYDKPNSRIVGGFNYLQMGADGLPVRMYQCKSASYQAASKSWLLKDVKILDMGEGMREPKMSLHDTFEITFPEDVSFFSNPTRDPAELNVLELLEEARRRVSMGFSPTQYLVEFHSSIAFPFMCLIVSIVGAVAGGMGSLRSSGPLIRSILISVAVMFLYILFFNMSRNLGNGGILPPVIAGWGPTTIFAIGAGVLVWMNQR